MIDNFELLQRYNFWNKPPTNIGIFRKEYINRIKNFMGNSLIKVFTGQRRTGKSYLLRQIIFKLIEDGINKKNIFYLNKEFTDFDEISNHYELDKLIRTYQQRVKPEGKVYLFIDEIQNIKSWEKLINSYSQSCIDDYEIFITGSNSNLLSGELASLLSGRYIQFLILPFNYNEYLTITKSDNSKI